MRRAARLLAIALPLHFRGEMLQMPAFSVDRKAGDVFVDYDGQAATASDLVAAAQAAGFKARPASP